MYSRKVTAIFSAVISIFVALFVTSHETSAATGKKLFLYTHMCVAQRSACDKSLNPEKIGLDYGRYYEIIRSTKTGKRSYNVVIVGENGRPRRIDYTLGIDKTLSIERSDYMWDGRTNTPMFSMADDVLEEKFLNAVSFFQMKYLVPVLSLIAALGLSVACGEGSSREREGVRVPGVSFDVTIAIVLLSIVTFNTMAGEMYGEAVENFEEFNAHLDARRLPSGNYQPLRTPGEWGMPFMVANLAPVWVLAHAVMVVLLLWRSPSLVRGLHFMFVPHPAHRGLRGETGARDGPRPLNAKKMAEDIRRETPKKPPPEYVSENMRRKARAHADRLKDDIDLMETAIERERTRTHYEEEQERRRNRAGGRTGNSGRGR